MAALSPTDVAVIAVGAIVLVAVFMAVACWLIEMPEPQGRHSSYRPGRELTEDEAETIEIFEAMTAPPDDSEDAEVAEWAHLASTWHDSTGTFAALVDATKGE